MFFFKRDKYGDGISREPFQKHTDCVSEMMFHRSVYDDHTFKNVNRTFTNH